jgi:hypothetical protein
MKEPDTLVKLCENNNIPVLTFKEVYHKAKIESGIPTLELIERGAVIGDFANYLKLEGRNYEPCQFVKAEWLDDGIGMSARIPVAYSERGKQLEPLPFLQSN